MQSRSPNQFSTMYAKKVAFTSANCLSLNHKTFAKVRGNSLIHSVKVDEGFTRSNAKPKASTAWASQLCLRAAASMAAGTLLREYTCVAGTRNTVALADIARD